MGIVAMDGTVAVIGARGDRAASETEPEAFLLQCALRRGQEKTPAGSGGANSFQGLKRETAPRAEPLLWVRLTSNQFSVEQAFLRFPVAFSL